MHSTCIFLFGMYLAGCVVGQMEIDVEGGSVNINSVSHASSNGMRTASASSTPNCDPNPSNEAIRTVQRCDPRDIRGCANDLVDRLCNCYPRIRWFAEVYTGGVVDRDCRADYCIAGAINRLSFYVVGVRSSCSGFTRDISTCNVRRACREMFNDGARYCSAIRAPTWADWCWGSNSCARERDCTRYGYYIYAFK